MKDWTTLIGTAACLVLGACGGSKAGNSGQSGNGASKAAVTTDGTLRLPVPAEFEARKSPTDLSDADFIAKGKLLYDGPGSANCVMCHGDSGKGDGLAAENYVDPKVADLTATGFQNAVTDQYLFWRIAKPIESRANEDSSMLGYPAGSEEDHWALVAYVRSLKGK